MSPYCCACDIPATRVCRHPQCFLPPFLCSGPCSKGISETMHTHNGTQDFIPYSQFQFKIEDIKYYLDSHSLHRRYLHKARKEVRSLKYHLSKEMEKLDQAYDQMLSDLMIRARIELSFQGEEILRRIDNGDNDRLKGANIRMLLGTEYERTRSKIAWAKIDHIKKDFAEGIAKLKEIDISNMFTSHDQRIEKSKILYQQGVALRKSNNFKQTISKMRQALQVNSCDDLIHFEIGYCLNQLNQLDEAEKSYLYSLQLNPSNSDTLNNIGALYIHRNNFEQAIKWYSRAIEKDSSDADIVMNRGDCYLELKKYEEALVDFSSALSLQPNTEVYIERIEEVSRLMKSKLK